MSEREKNIKTRKIILENIDFLLKTINKEQDYLVGNEDYLLINDDNSLNTVEMWNLFGKVVDENIINDLNDSKKKTIIIEKVARLIKNTIEEMFSNEEGILINFFDKLGWYVIEIDSKLSSKEIITVFLDKKRMIEELIRIRWKKKIVEAITEIEELLKEKNKTAEELGINDYKEILHECKTDKNLSKILKRLKIDIQNFEERQMLSISENNNDKKLLTITSFITIIFLLLILVYWSIKRWNKREFEN